jgi:hypothetical protein
VWIPSARARSSVVLPTPGRSVSLAAQASGVGRRGGGGDDHRCERPYPSGGSGGDAGSVAVARAAIERA